VPLHKFISIKNKIKKIKKTSKFFLTTGSRIEEFWNVILRYVTS